MEHSSFTDAVVAIDTTAVIAVMVISAPELNQLQVKKFKKLGQSTIENAFDALAFYNQKGFVICSRTWFETVRLRALKYLKTNIYYQEANVA